MQKPKRVVSVIFCLVVLLANFGLGFSEEKMPITTKSEAARALYLEGLQAIEQVELAKARKLLNEAIQKDSDFFMPYYQLAVFDLYFNNETRFWDYATKAVKCDAKLSAGEELLRKALGKFLEDPKADVTDIGAELLEMYPKDKQAYYSQQVFQWMIGDYEDAVVTTKKAMEITDNPAPLYNSLGYLYMQLEKFSEANAAFEKYIELQPQQPNPYDSMGDYYMAVEDYERAYESFMKAYEIDNTWASSLNKAKKAKELIKK